MKRREGINKYLVVITTFLALVGIGLMSYYEYCDTACSYLTGDIFGMDLKWVGIAFMAVLIIFSAISQQTLVRILLAAGLGVEVFLYSFQIENDVHCPFCTAFSLMVIAAFIVNYEVPSAWRENRRLMWLYCLGEVNLPILKIQKLPLLVVSVLGYFIIFLTFSGSVTPAYGQDQSHTVPSLGEGPYEVTVFADYFCSPCRKVDAEAEPLLRALLATDKVKITFVDVPFSRSTVVYSRYYLYSANANRDPESIFHIRTVLFDAAQDNRIRKEDDLVSYLKEQKISWKVFDEKSIFPLLNDIIKENDIRETPVCIINYPSAGREKYIGTDEILDGLMKLISQIGMDKHSSRHCQLS